MRDLKTVLEGVFDEEDNIRSIDSKVKCKKIFNDILTSPSKSMEMTFHMKQKLLRDGAKKVPMTKMDVSNNYIWLRTLRSDFGLSYDIVFLVSANEKGWYQWVIEFGENQYTKTDVYAASEPGYYEKKDLKIDKFYEKLSSEFFTMPDDWMYMIELIKEYEKSK